MANLCSMFGMQLVSAEALIFKYLPKKVSKVVELLVWLCCSRVCASVCLSLSSSQLFSLCVNVLRGLRCLKHSSVIYVLSTFQWNRCTVFPLCVT